jgi:hypothetical protein
MREVNEFIIAAADPAYTYIGCARPSSSRRSRFQHEPAELALSKPLSPEDQPRLDYEYECELLFGLLLFGYQRGPRSRN